MSTDVTSSPQILLRTNRYNLLHRWDNKTHDGNACDRNDMRACIVNELKFVNLLVLHSEKLNQ